MDPMTSQDGGPDYRAQSHAHRRRLAKQTGGVAYPNDSRQADSSYSTQAEATKTNTSVLNTPSPSLVGQSLADRQLSFLAGVGPKTGAAQTDFERRTYGVYNR